MNWRRNLLEALTLIVAAVLCAGVANALAGRERKLALVKLSEQRAASSEQAVTATVAPETTTTIAPVTPDPATTTTVATATSPATTTTHPPAPAPATTTTAAPTSPTPAPATPAPAPAPATPAKRFLPHPDKEYVEIGYDDVASLYGQHVLFLDARRTSVYEQGHIAGSRSFSVWESDIDDKVNKLYEERNDPRQQLEPIVIYCSGGDCEDSHMLARKLWGLQFNNIWVYKDGFPDWEKRGGKISRGANP